MLKRLLLAAVVVSPICLPSDVEADLVIQIQQVGEDVVVTGEGSLALGGLTFDGDGFNFGSSGINPQLGNLRFSPDIGEGRYRGDISGPSNFGLGGSSLASVSSGDNFGFSGSADNLSVPVGYIPGSPLSGSMTFDSTTIASLGIDTGTFVWSWEVPASPVAGDLPIAVNGAFTERVTLTVVPEPSAFAFLGLLGLVAGGRSWWKRRR